MSVLALAPIPCAEMIFTHAPTAAAGVTMIVTPGPTLAPTATAAPCTRMNLVQAPTAAVPIIVAPRIRAPRGGFAFGGRHYPGGCYLPRAARAALEVHALKASQASTAGAITVGILGFDYRLRALPIVADDFSHKFMLTATDRAGQSYIVLASRQGETSCSCPDWEYRRKAIRGACKHTARLVELGLVPATRPTVLPPFAVRGGTTDTTPARAPAAAGGMTRNHTPVPAGLAARGITQNDTPAPPSLPRPRLAPPSGPLL